jgi:hypothetical protein
MNEYELRTLRGLAVVHDPNLDHLGQLRRSISSSSDRIDAGIPIGGSVLQQ